MITVALLPSVALGIHCLHNVLCFCLFKTVLPFKNSCIKTDIKTSLWQHFISNMEALVLYAKMINVRKYIVVVVIIIIIIIIIIFIEPQ